MADMTTAKRGAPRRNEIKDAELSLRAATLMAWVVKTTGATDPKALDIWCRTRRNEQNQKAIGAGNDPLSTDFWGSAERWEVRFSSAEGTDPKKLNDSTLVQMGRVLPSCGQMYKHGPDGILDHVFSADIWGDPLMQLRGLVPNRNTHDMLDDFARYLDARHRHATISPDDACVAIRLYRAFGSHDQMLASPAYQLMCYCLEQPSVQVALGAYGINAPLRRYLETVERDRVARNKAAKRKITEAGHPIEDPVETYVKDPLTFVAAINRKPRTSVTPRSIVSERQFLPRIWRSLHMSRSDARRVLISVLALLVLATASQIVTAHRLQAQIKTLNHELRATAHS